MKHQITILIPCFNQPFFASDCLQSIKNQTNKDFKVILIDDGSNEVYYNQYLKLVEFYSNEFDIDIIQNKSNKGAYLNQINCILSETDSEYKIVFHEDDILHPTFIENNLKIFKENTDIAFIVTQADFFSNSTRPNYQFESNSIDYKIITNYRDLVDLYLFDFPYSFGSVVYNNKYLKNTFFEIDKYSVCSDRPFLIELAKKNVCVVINNKLVLNNNHEEETIKWKTLNQLHIKNLYQFLYENKNENLTKTDLKKVNYLITKNIIGGWKLLSIPQRPNFISYLIYFKHHKLLHLTLLMEIKLKLFLTPYVAMNNVFRRIIRKIKRLLGIQIVELSNIKGIKIHINHNEYIDKGLLYNQFETDTIEIFQKLCNPGQTFFDIGANIGFYTLLGAKLIKGGSVYSFEPTSLAYKKLQRNIKANSFTNIKAVKLALSDREEVTQSFIKSSWPIDNNFNQRNKQNELIEYDTLDNFVKKFGINKIDLIKIDVDGFEYKVINGAKNTLKVMNPLIVFELVAYTLKEKGDDIHDLAKLLTDLGYNFYDEKTLEKYHDIDKLINDPYLENFSKNVILSKINTDKLNLLK